jgi:hypothetical protein
MSGMHLFPNTGSPPDDVRQRGLFSKLESKFAQVGEREMSLSAWHLAQSFDEGYPAI